MKKSIVLLLLSLSIFFLFLGIFVGAYNIFPYSELNSIKNQIKPESVINAKPSDTLNINNLISIQNKDDILEKRNMLIQFIWKTNNIPSQLPDTVEINIDDKRFNTFSNLRQIDKLTIEMESGVTSVVYIFLPEISNGKMILYHQGHSGGFVNGKDTIQKFIDSGFSVAAFSMPLIGLNTQPIIEIDNIGPVKFLKHNQFVYLDKDNFSSMSYFFTPISITLNHIDKNFSFNEYHMVGISGGGWTSTVYPAIDTRISESFSIAGSLPLSLRNVIDDIGDYEQYNPEFYSIANYYELYIMSSFGENREHIQIFNKYDSCCFAGNTSNYYKDLIQESISNLNSGNFDIIIDDTHFQHKISNSTIELIINKII